MLYPCCLLSFFLLAAASGLSPFLTSFLPLSLSFYLSLSLSLSLHLQTANSTSSCPFLLSFNHSLPKSPTRSISLSLYSTFHLHPASSWATTTTTSNSPSPHLSAAPFYIWPSCFLAFFYLPVNHPFFPLFFHTFSPKRDFPTRTYKKKRILPVSWSWVTPSLCRDRLRCSALPCVSPGTQ